MGVKIGDWVTISYKCKSRCEETLKSCGLLKCEADTLRKIIEMSDKPLQVTEIDKSGDPIVRNVIFSEDELEKWVPNVDDFVKTETFKICKVVDTENIEQNGTLVVKPTKEVNIGQDKKTYSYLTLNMLTNIDSIEPWFPESGDLCLFKWDKSQKSATLARFDHFTTDGNYLPDGICEMRHCEPFIGEWPEFLKNI